MKRRDALNVPKPTAPTVSAQEKPQPLDKAEAKALDALVGGDGVLSIPHDQIEKVLPEDGKSRLIALKAERERLNAEPFVHALTEGTKIANVRAPAARQPEHAR